MKIELKERAVGDVRAAIDWYNTRRELLGFEFLDELNDVLRATAEHPLMYQVVEDEVRRALLKRFPFSVYYIPESGKLVVLAVLHTRQHPDPWRGGT
jgi:plasmid stabilization system protein ParE